MEQTDGTLQLTASSCWVRKLATDEIGDGRSPDVVTAFSVTDRLPLDTEMCEVKSNEIKATPKIIERADYMNGCVITADAMSCQSSIIKGIVGKGADYLIALKANQKNGSRSGNLPTEGCTNAAAVCIQTYQASRHLKNSSMSRLWLQ